MKRFHRRCRRLCILAALLVLLVLFLRQNVLLDTASRHAILLDAQSGRVLAQKRADERTAPASLTKMMTVLLAIETEPDLDKQVTLPEDIFPALQTEKASMAGFVPDETVTVRDLLYGAMLPSGAECCEALAQLVSGSEENFAALMNQKAAELGMENTHFACCAGLDNEGHYSTARDIALMSRALLRYPKITDYTTIWMDTLRNGATSLVNTNRLVRFYQGATGLKTGTTNGAGCCLSASASRDGLGLIAVVLGAGNSNDRFAAARALLDWGYANLAAVNITPPELEPLAVIRGTAPTVELTAQPPAEGIVIPKGQREAMTQTVNLAESLEAPIAAGTEVGTVTVTVEGQTVASYPVVTAAAVERMTFGRAFQRLGQGLLAMG